MNRQLQKDFRILGKMGEGTFSEVFKCQKLADEKYYACKKMKQRYDSREQVDSLREIQSMKKLSHPNVIRLEEICYDSRSGSLALILELMDMNIYELIRGRKHYLSDAKVGLFMWQLCQALDHVHSRGIFHRDVKPENILIKGDMLKLADFGSCRSINSRQPYTEYISTRWYRAPECLLTDGCYSYQMDCWSAGCVMYEIMSLKPLFPGSNEVDQIAKIHDVIGTPNSDILMKFKNKTRAIPFNFPKKKGSGIERLLPTAGAEAVDLIKRFCEYDPDKRLSAKYSLKHPYFKTIREKFPLHHPQERISPVQSRENKENFPTMSPSDHSSSLMKSMDTQQKEKERRKHYSSLLSHYNKAALRTLDKMKRRKAAPYYTQGSSANLTFPSLFTKSQSGQPLGQAGYTSGSLPKMHLPTLFQNSHLPYKSRNKFQTGNAQYHSLFRRLPASDKNDYASYSLHSHQMK